MTPRPARSLTAIGITALPGGGVAAVVAAAAPANAAATNLLTNPGFETGVHRAADDRRGVGVAGPAGQVASNPDADGRRPPTGLAQVLDVKHVGMFGQSGGGFTALEAITGPPKVRPAFPWL
jgi:dienelactone hydrolase